MNIQFYVIFINKIKFTKVRKKNTDKVVKMTFEVWLVINCDKSRLSANLAGNDRTTKIRSCLKAKLVLY